MSAHAPRDDRDAQARSAALQPMGLPQPVHVRVDAHGLPWMVTRTGARGRLATPVRVQQVEDVWRVSEAWWREEPQARTYLRVILEGGRPLTLFHDDRPRAEGGGGWYEQPYASTGGGA